LGLTAQPTPLPTPTPIAPDFPLTAPTPSASPLDLVAMTPPPTPPSDFAASVGPFPDLDVMAIEVTQGIQDLNNNMPLVAGRRTYARVYLDVIGANELAHSYGALEARRDGQQIGWIWPENGPITAIANGGNRLELNDSLYFRLPHAWLDGTVKLTAFVYSHQVEFAWSKEAQWQNNFEVETVTFHEAQPLDIHLATLHLHRSFHPTDVVREYVPTVGGELDLANASANDTARILAGLRRYHPISELTFDVFPIPIRPLEHDSGDEWDLGDCSTTVVSDDATVTLADWRPLMDEENQADVVVDAYTEPDNDTIWVMDRTIEVTNFYAREDGSASVFGSMTGSGPAPIPGAPAYVNGCPNPNDESWEPNSTLAEWRALYDWADVREFFVGLVDPSLPTRWGGLASTLDTAWVKMNPNTGPDWYLGGASTLAHEVGHLGGLNHVSCKDDDDDGVPDELIGGPIDPTHPQEHRFPACSLAEVRDYGYYGFDAYHDLFGLAEPKVISNDPDAGWEDTAYPLLSYQGPKWIDPYHYCLLLAYYGVPCDADGLDEPFDPPTNADDFWQPTGHGDPPPDPGLPLLLVSGSIDRDGSNATLDGQLTIDEPTTALLEQLDRQAFVADEDVVARLVVSDADGAILFEAPIADRSSVHGTVGRFGIKMLVPVAPDAVLVEVVDPSGRTTEGITLHHEGFERVSRFMTGPDISDVDDLVGACCSIDVDGVDADTLRSTLLYSPDGEHWQVIGTASGTEVPLDEDVVDALPGSEEGRLRIIVSDGVRTTSATSETAVRVPNRAPVAWIDSPAVPTSFPLGGRITLSGAGQDKEDRAMPDEQLAWSSSIDGALGTGPEIMTRGLSVGRHTIRLTATDADGATAEASIELVVDGSVVAAAPPAELEAAVAGILDRFGSGGDPSPIVAIDPVSESIPMPVLIAVTLVLLGAGATSVWIRVSQPHVAGAGGPAIIGGFKSLSGMGAEHDVGEAPEPPDEPTAPTRSG
jgi:hypothetical protein